MAPPQSGHALVIDLAKIPTHGLTLEAETEPTRLHVPQAESVAGPICVQAVLTKVTEQVYVQGRIAGTVVVPCSRCLETVGDNFVAEFQVVFLPPDMRGADNEAGWDEGPDDLDLYIHDGLRLDLRPLVRDQVVLSFPVQTLCREDCAGLCQVCGGNRNETPCSCQEASGDPRFAILKRLTMPDSS